MHKSPYPALILTFLIFVMNVWTVLANLVKVIECRKHLENMKVQQKTYRESLEIMLDLEF